MEKQDTAMKHLKDYTCLSLRWQLINLLKEEYLFVFLREFNGVLNVSCLETSCNKTQLNEPSAELYHGLW